MIFRFDVTIHTRPADKQALQTRTITLQADNRADAIDWFWAQVRAHSLSFETAPSVPITPVEYVDREELAARYPRPSDAVHPVPAGECRCECPACEHGQHHGWDGTASGGNCQIDPPEEPRPNEAEREIDRLVTSKTGEGRPMHPRTSEENARTEQVKHPCTDKPLPEADATGRDHQLVNELLERWRVDSAFCFMVRGQLARLLAQVRTEERQRIERGLVQAIDSNRPIDPRARPETAPRLDWIRAHLATLIEAYSTSEDAKDYADYVKDVCTEIVAAIDKGMPTGSTTGEGSNG